MTHIDWTLVWSWDSLPKTVFTLWLIWLKLWCDCAAHLTMSPLHHLTAWSSRNSSQTIFWHFAWLTALIVVISPAMCPSDSRCWCDAQPQRGPAVLKWDHLPVWTRKNLFMFEEVICGWCYCVSRWGRMDLAGSQPFLWCGVKSHIVKWAWLQCGWGEQDHAAFILSFIAARRSSAARGAVFAQRGVTLKSKVEPINKHERTGMAGLLVKSNMWGGKLSSLRYQRVCVISAEKKKSGTAGLVLLKWHDESGESWHSGVFKNRSDLDYFQAAWGRSVCGFTHCCVAGELPPLYSQLAGATLCKWLGAWKEHERMLISSYRT